MTENRSCRKYMDKYADSKVNCCTCVKWDRENARCKDEVEVKRRYEDSTEFRINDQLIRKNKGVYLD